jgi:hypothetical protein
MFKHSILLLILAKYKMCNVFGLSLEYFCECYNIVLMSKQSEKNKKIGGIVMIVLGVIMLLPAIPAVVSGFINPSILFLLGGIGVVGGGVLIGYGRQLAKF